MEILAIKELEINAITPLVELSLDEGYNFLNRLVNNWTDGSNRFDKPNEQLYQVKMDGKIIGIGGINQNPYSNEEKSGRLRRFYIHPQYRRKKIGTELVKKILADHKKYYKKITLRTDTEAAAKFYEALGFVKVEDSTTDTHKLLI